MIYQGNDPPPPTQKLDSSKTVAWNPPLILLTKGELSWLRPAFVISFSPNLHGYKQVGSLLGCPHLYPLMGGRSYAKVYDIFGRRAISLPQKSWMACIPKQPKTPKQAVFESYVPYNSFKLFIHFCQKHMDLGLAFWGLSTHTPFGLQKQNSGGTNDPKIIQTGKFHESGDSK